MSLKFPVILFITNNTPLFCNSAGSAKHTLCVNSWDEFLVTTKILVKNMNKRELELNMTPPFLLQPDQVITLYNGIATKFGIDFYTASNSLHMSYLEKISNGKFH